MKAVIEIAADSRGVVAGLQPANKALDDTAKKADRAEQEVKQLGHSGEIAGRNMSAAFAATGGGLAITHGLEGIAGGLRSGSGAMATFAASQALLDLGRFVEDMKGVTAATGGATSIFGTLGAVMKAHPLMTIATVLAGAASAMAIFSSDTEEAANEFERLGEAMEKVRLGRAASELLGISQLTQAQQAQQAVRDVAQQVVAGPMTYGQMAKSLNVDVRDLLALQQAGGVGLPEAQFRQIGGGGGQLGAMGRRELTVPEYQVTREAAQAILRTLYRNLEQEAKSLQATGQPPSALPGVAGGTIGVDLFPGQAPAPQVFSPAMQYQAGITNIEGGTGTGLGLMMPGMNLMGTAVVQSAEYMREQNELAKQRMQELISLGEQFGQTIGDAFFRVAEGTMTARQAMAELVRMFAQMAAQGIFRQIGGAVGASFAPSQAQATANAGGGNISAGFSPPSG